MAKDVRKSELEMAKTLMKIIKVELKSKEAKLTSTEEPRQAEVVDLMERLRQSLQGAATGARKPAKTRKTAARRSTRKKTKAA